MLAAVTADNVFSFVSGFIVALVFCFFLFFVWLRLRWRELLYRFARGLVFKSKREIERRILKKRSMPTERI
jgi:hypothetical protein